MVRRLVEYEKVRGPGHQARDLQPPLLPCGQRRYRDVQVLRTEQAQRQQLFGVLLRQPGSCATAAGTAVWARSRMGGFP
ncbi:hypothetical protein GCM10027074_75050 [Streptomyces deserti]